MAVSERDARGFTGTRPAESVPLTRTLLLHTGGSFWVDVTGIEGTRDNLLLRWMPGSPRIELGMLSSALMSLPLLSDTWGRRVSHFMLGLSPRGPSPSGESGQLAVAMATLWYRHAANAGLPLVRAGAGADAVPAAQPQVVLTGSGTLRQRRTAHGLFGYCVEPVYGWEDKLRQLDAALLDVPLAALHLVCAPMQLAQVRSALLHTLPGRVRPGPDGDARRLLFESTSGRVGLYLHPVATLRDVAGVMQGLAAPHAGRGTHVPMEPVEPVQPIRAASSSSVPVRWRARPATCRGGGRASGQGRRETREVPCPAPRVRAGPAPRSPLRRWRQARARGLVWMALLWLVIGSLSALFLRQCAGQPAHGGATHSVDK